MFNESWVYAAIALFIGCVVQTSVGFGMAVIAAPIIVLFKPEWVPIVITIVALALSLQNSWGQRTYIEWHIISPAMVTRVPGTIIGAWILSLLYENKNGLQILIAIMVLIAVFVTAFSKPFQSNAKNISIAGFFSGIAGTTTSIGGPPMALVMQHGHSHNTRANLSIYFVYSCITALISYHIIGLLNKEMWLIGISFIPIGLAGYKIGTLLRHFVDQRFRTMLLVLCLLSAFIAFYGAII